jgi:hypothetical protein
MARSFQHSNNSVHLSGRHQVHCSNYSKYLALQAYISVGSLAKQHLTSGRIQNIIHNMKPFLVRHAYDAALERATVQIGLSLSNVEQPGEGEGGDSEENEGPWWVVFVPIGLFASIFGFSQWRGRRRRRQTTEATRHLRRLQADIKVCCSDAAQPDLAVFLCASKTT